MKNIYIIILNITLLFLSCNDNKKASTTESTAKYEINIDKLNNKGIAPISSYFDTVTPIVLETNENCLIKDIDAIQTTSNYIFILDGSNKKLFCFGKDGEFIKAIGNMGVGPGEYSNISDFTIDNHNETIYLLDNYVGQIHQFKLTGQHVSSISIDKSINGIFGHIQYHNNKLYVDYCPRDINIDIDTPLIIELDINSGEKTDQFLSAETNNIGFRPIIHKNNSHFYSKNHNPPIYAPFYSNTLFSIENNFKPYFTINSSRALKKEDVKDLDLFDSNSIVKINDLDRIYCINNFIDTEKYIICEYSEKYALNTLIYSKPHDSYELYQGFYDDLTYNKLEESIPHYLACADKWGLYTYIDNNEIPIFIDFIKSGKINIDLSQFTTDCTNDISEDSNPIIFYYEAK